jgi:hypothetical protein
MRSQFVMAITGGSLGCFLMWFPKVQELCFSHIVLAGCFFGFLIPVFAIVFKEIPKSPVLSARAKRIQQLVVVGIGGIILMSTAIIWFSVWRDEGWLHYRIGIVIGGVICGTIGWIAGHDLDAHR